MIRIDPEFVRLRKFNGVLVLSRRLDPAHPLHDPLQLSRSEPLALFRFGSHHEPRTAQVRQISSSVVGVLPCHQRVDLGSARHTRLTVSGKVQAMYSYRCLSGHCRHAIA